MQRKGGLLDRVPGASVRVARAGRATASSRRLAEPLAWFWGLPGFP